MASDEVKAAMLRLVAALEGDDEDKEEWLDGVRRERWRLYQKLQKESPPTKEEFEAALDAFSDSEEVASCVGRIDGYWPKEAETQIIGLWRLANELYAALNPASSQSPQP